MQTNADTFLDNRTNYMREEKKVQELPTE